MKIILENNILSTAKGLNKDVGLGWVDESLPAIPGFPETQSHRIWRLALGFDNDSADAVTLPGFFNSENQVRSDFGIPHAKDLFYAMVFSPTTGLVRREAFIAPNLERNIWQGGVRTATETPITGDLVLQPGQGLRTLSQQAILDTARVPDGLYELNLSFDSLPKYDSFAFKAWLIDVRRGQVKILREL